MKLYTKSGDRGETGLYAGPRVWKNDPRIEAFGAVDELNAVLGLARAETPDEELDRLLEQIQHELFAVGAELATPDPVGRGTDLIGQRHVEQLEAAIDRWDADLPPLKQFILPAGTLSAACLHTARAVCRRAERQVVSLARAVELDRFPIVLQYLNRLGDLLFVMARRANQLAGQTDVAWQKPPRTA